MARGMQLRKAIGRRDEFSRAAYLFQRGMKEVVRPKCTVWRGAQVKREKTAKRARAAGGAP